MQTGTQCTLCETLKSVMLQFSYCAVCICALFVLFGRENGTVKFLTKGDNNQVDDRGLYAPGQLWLDKSDVVGRAKG